MLEEELYDMDKEEEDDTEVESDYSDLSDFKCNKFL